MEIKKTITWVVAKRTKRYEFVDVESILMEEGNIEEPAKILEFKNNFKIIANNPGGEGLECICNKSHDWNLTGRTEAKFKDSQGLHQCRRLDRKLKFYRAVPELARP